MMVVSRASEGSPEEEGELSSDTSDSGRIQGTADEAEPVGTGRGRLDEMPPGYYPDPRDATRLRWWNGRQWTGGTVQPTQSGPRPARHVGRIVALYVVLTVIGFLAVTASDTSHVLEKCTDTSTWSLTDTPLSTALWLLGVTVAAGSITLAVVRRRKEPDRPRWPVPEIVALVLAIVLPWLGLSVSCGG